MAFTKEELKGYTAVLTGIAGVATAIASCNTSAQERLQADNKIYSVLAESITKQNAEIVTLHKDVDELRGYLQAVRASTPPAPALVPLTRPLLPLPAPAVKLPDLPPAAPAPALRPLPKFSDL